MDPTFCIGKTKGCMQVLHPGFSFLKKGLFLLILYTFLQGFEVNAQIKTNPVNQAPLAYDEIPVHVLIEGVGSFYVDAFYTNTNYLYIDIGDLFKTLSIQCVFTPGGDSITGFIEKESRPYLIDYQAKKIFIDGKSINPANGLIKEMGTLYVESSLFEEAFGIILTFNFRALTLILKSNFELPLIKQMRLEKLQSNLSKIKGEVIADTLLKRDYHLFRFGMVDWSVGSSQSWGGSTDNHFSLGVGTELLFGEANVSVNYYDRYKFDDRQVQYLWRWVDNEKTIIKQAQIGKIFNQTIAFINSPVIGAIVRNSPTTLRNAKGFYTISEYTEPNWTVELYINNVLVSYTKADASGLYFFKVPIVYGYTTLKFKFYGPMGEERTDERIMNVPYTIMPAGEFEYGLSGGVLQDSVLSRFGKGEFNFGINRFITAGGGLEYLSSIVTGAYIPFAKATLQPFSKLIINGEYAYGVRARGLLNYYFGKNALLEIDYAKYAKGQLATRFNATEERKIKLSLPFNNKIFSGFAKLDFTQLVYSDFYYNQSSVMVSAYYKQFSVNSSTQVNWITNGIPFVSSDLALSYRLKKGFVIRPSAQFNVTESKFIMAKAEIEKRISKFYASISYQRNFLYGGNSVNFNLKYDLSFARTSVSAIYNAGRFYTSEGAQGSLAFGSGKNYVQASNNSSVSKGGISLYPFLDLNNNGLFDSTEHMVKVTTVRIEGGKAIIRDQDSVLRIPELNAFVSYTLEFGDNDLENIAWRFKHKIWRVLVDPNQYKRIDIPIIASGEVSGMVYLNKENALKGIGRIWVKFYDKTGTKEIAKTLSESDGFIDYLGLAPGDYIARIDTVQLKDLDYKADPPFRNFTIKTSEQGDIVGGVEFVLQTKSIKLPRKLIPEAAQKKEIKETGQTITVQTEKIVPTEKIVSRPVFNLYKVQLSASRKPLNIKEFFSKLLRNCPGLDIVEKKGEDGYYRYTCGTYRSIANARELVQRIINSGWKECFIAVEKQISQ